MHVRVDIAQNSRRDTCGNMNSMWKWRTPDYSSSLDTSTSPHSNNTSEIQHRPRIHSACQAVGKSLVFLMCSNERDGVLPCGDRVACGIWDTLLSRVKTMIGSSESDTPTLDLRKSLSLQQDSQAIRGILTFFFRGRVTPRLKSDS